MLGRWTGDVWQQQPDGSYLKIIDAYYPPETAWNADGTLNYLVLQESGWPETRVTPFMASGDFGEAMASVPVQVLPIGKWVPGWSPFLEPWPHQMIGNNSVWIISGEWHDENVKYRVASRSEVDPSWEPAPGTQPATASITDFAGTTTGKIVISIGLYLLYDMFIAKGK